MQTFYIRNIYQKVTDFGTLRPTVTAPLSQPPPPHQAIARGSVQLHIRQQFSQQTMIASPVHFVDYTSHAMSDSQRRKVCVPGRRQAKRFMYATRHLQCYTKIVVEIGAQSVAMVIDYRKISCWSMSGPGNYQTGREAHAQCNIAYASMRVSLTCDDKCKAI